MGAEGLEPSQPCDQQILSLVRLPFRHAPVIHIPIGWKMTPTDIPVTEVNQNILSALFFIAQLLDSFTENSE